MFEKHPYNKKFSIAHWDRIKDENTFYECIKNSSQQWKNEIYDIYFGVTFENADSLTGQGGIVLTAARGPDDVTYGNTMGVNASEAQYKNLLKIQEKYNIPISLTLNEMNRPFKLLKEKNIKEFIAFIKKYYDDGVRSCTISHTHLMRTGALQSAFPDMDWKNTVNHQVMSTQSVIDYAKLGYTTIQLDRNFNRNLTELKRVKLEADRLNVKTCLLIKESCMPECPFKKEHDCWQSGKELKSTGKTYWELINFTCNRWRITGRGLGVSSPRTGTDVIIHGKEDWNDFAGLVDIFKFSGRLDPLVQTIKIDPIFFRGIEMEKEGAANELFKVDDFKTIYENNLMPFHQWFMTDCIIKNYPVITDINKIKEGIKNHFWNKEQAVLLSKVLKNCKNQCYKCHKCDDLFETKKVDSILEF
jgi:hypothetical protein